MKKSKFSILILSFSIISLSLSMTDNNTWFKIYDSPYHSDSYGNVVCKADGNNDYIISAVRRTSSQVQNIYVLKLNEYGDTLWAKIFREDINVNSIVNTAVSTPDGGCVMSGQGNILFSVKINSAGGVVWDKTYPGGGRLHDIKMTSDNGFIGCGDISSFKGYIIKLDSLGNREWNRTYTDGFFNSFTSVVELTNSVYMITGIFNQTITDTTKELVIKMNGQGDISLNKKLLVNNRTAAGVKIVKDNNDLIIAGVTVNATSSFNASYFQKIDTSGNILFANILEPNQQESLQDFKILSYNKYLLSVVRYNFNDSTYAKVIICDSIGTVLNYKNFFVDSAYTIILSLDKTFEGYYVFAGYIGRQYDNILVIKTDSNLNYNPVSIFNSNIQNEIQQYQLFQNYPNPFNPSTNIKFSLQKEVFVEINLYDISGKLVRVLVSKKFGKGLYNNFFDMSDLSSGIYFYSLTINKNIFDTKKLILLK